MSDLSRYIRVRYYNDRVNTACAAHDSAILLETGNRFELTNSSYRFQQTETTGGEAQSFGAHRGD